MALAKRLAPLDSAPAVEKRVAVLDARMHQRQVDARGQRQALPVDLRPADDHDLAAGPPRLAGLVEIGDDRAIACREIGGPAQHQIEPSRQCAADRLVGPAAHQHGLTERKRFESAQIPGQPPRQLIAAPDDVVLGHCDDYLHADLYDGGAKPASSRNAAASPRLRILTSRRIQLDFARVLR